ncbi:Na/Pi cotransporter family protein [Sneathiella limimaris]|uniref:Na/Pi cotransporter family protein n=1 Tax=Sneathiella limimaris TaxID=1964213 RepID=UPI00146A3972|nr:Na/Pi cotransporter family protein [Sneathiella limimaris]
MHATTVLISLFGGVALLLWGLRMVNTGVTRAYGRELGKILNFSLKNRFNSFLGGLGVTMLLQSSTATALLTASFAGRGMVAASAGIAVMLGADVGTTLVAQVLSFDLSWLAPVLLFLGFIRHSTAKSTRAKNLGRIMLGLGMMLTALKLLVAASEPIRDSEVAQFVFSSLSGEPVMTVLIGGLLTFVAHSSLATVLFILTLVKTGGIPLDVAFAMILGANLGGALPPLLATLNADAASRRPPLGNLICRLTAVIVVLPFLTLVQAEMARLTPDITRQVVNFHTFFNLGLAAFFIFFTGPMGRLTEILAPERALTDSNAPGPIHLDRAALESPQLAIANAIRDTLRLGDVVEQMFRNYQVAFEKNDPQLLEKVRDADESIKEFNAGIKSYLTELGRESLEEEDEARCTEIMTFTTNMENIGNIVVLNMAELLERSRVDQVVFSKEDIDDHHKLFEMLLNNLKLSFTVFLTQEVGQATNLLSGKQALRDKERKAVNSHLQRLRQGPGMDEMSSGLHLGLLSDLRRINSMITAVAYPVLAKEEKKKKSALQKNETKKKDKSKKKLKPEHKL